MKPFLVVLAGADVLWVSETIDKARIVLVPVTSETLAAKYPKLAERLMETRGLEAPRVVEEKEDRSTFLW